MSFGQTIRLFHGRLYAQLHCIQTSFACRSCIHIWAQHLWERTSVGARSQRLNQNKHCVTPAVREWVNGEYYVMWSFDGKGSDFRTVARVIL